MSIYAQVNDVIGVHGVPNIARWANPDSIGTLQILSITQTGGVATATYATTTGQAVAFIPGDVVNISGVTPAGYNGTGLTVTGTGTAGTNTFSYVVNPATSTPATILGTVQMSFPSGRVIYWLNQSDAKINSIFLAKQIYLRIGQASIVQGQVSLQLTNKWAINFASKWLYEGARGLVDDDPIKGKLNAAFNESETEIKLCAGDNGQGMGFDAGRTFPMAGNGSPIAFSPDPNRAWGPTNGLLPQNTNMFGYRG